jgi:hypothetical protein
MNDWLYNYLRGPFKHLIPNDKRYTLVFDKLEILIALAYAYLEKESNLGYWVPLGAFGYRHDSMTIIMKEIEDSIAQSGEQSSYVQSGIFGSTVEVCSKGIADLKNFMSKISWY